MNMNPDKYDFFRHVTKEPANVALDLLRGLEDRTYNYFRKNVNAKDSREIFAEDELVRKKGYDEMRCEMPGQPRSTFLMVFSPDGSKVASTHGNHNIYVTDIKSGKNIKTLIGHPRTPWCIAFHPTSNQIVASGCLGGEVRIWDLSGGSEVWTAGNQSVIASIAFHPNDRVLVIATYNELYFWDWSRPEPFVQVATANPKEKIRYVAFDKLGHKLITGIANSPQTRWERVRAPVPVPRQAERSASPYRLRITSRLVNSASPHERDYFNPGSRNETVSTSEPARDSMSSVPERERRITASYRNLLREYEQLVQRYLKVYKPPTMIDRGTDPMEMNPPSTSGTQPSGSSPETEPQPSTSQSSSLVMPSRILAIKRQRASNTQTTDSRKHKSSETAENPSQEKRSKCEESASTSHTETATQTQSPRKVLVVKEKSPQPGPSTSSSFTAAPSTSSAGTSSRSDMSDPQPSTSRGTSTSNEDILSNLRPIAEELRTRFLPIVKSLPACDRPKLIRRFENSRALERLKFRQVCPTFTKKPNRRPVQSSDGSSSDDDLNSTAPQTTPSDLTIDSNNSQRNSSPPSAPPSTSTVAPPTNISGFRNFIMELEQLLMTILMTEIEGNDSSNTLSNSANTPTESPTNLATTTSATSEEPNNSSEMRSSPVYMSANRDQDLIRPNAVLLGNSIFRRLIQRQDILVQARANLVQQLESRSVPSPPTEEQPRPSTSSGSSLNTSSSSSSARTSAPIYTRTYPRRRLSCHRISAFMPTRVNYNRTPMRYRRGTMARIGNTIMRIPAGPYPIDEPINYSQRPNAEDLPQELLVQPNDSLDPSEALTDPASPSPTPDSGSLGSMYSNIVQDLETSLNDVRNLRASNRPGETSDMLSSFSESLENIMNQSDTILRNLGGSMSMLPNYNTEDTASSGSARTQPVNEPHLSFNDQSFYVGNRSDPNRDVLNLSVRGGRSVIESDHNYPRNLPNQSPGDSMSPLMTSLHLTISYIQRQARLLRQQVESIERIDRAMFEVEQLQLIRQLIIEFSRYVRSLSGESRSTGMSSVRQMMAGTRISDSSPYDSQSEEAAAGPSNPTPSTSSAQSAPGPSEPTQPRPRTSGRKTYPPSRLHRLQRHNRRSLFVNFFPRRYAARSDRIMKHSGPCRTASARQNAEPSNPLLRNLSSYNLINSASLNLMAARLEHLLTDQTRLITRPQEAHSQPSTSRTSNATTAMEERMLSLRLHDCALRMDRILGTRLEGSRFRNTRTDSVVVTQDGAMRFPARHFLSLIVDRMSKHVEDLGGGNNISLSIRGQIHNVLAMALLLSDLLLLQLVDSIPPPAGMNLDVERESLTSRIDQMCGQMLQNRFSGHSHHLTRSLHHMRLTMRHAYRALGQTYNARRNAMMPNRLDTSRRQLLNIYLRNMNNRRRQNLSSDQTTTSSSERDNPSPSTSSELTRGWGGLRDLIMRYSDNTGEDEEITGTSNNQNERERSSPRIENAWSNNSDDNDDESEWYLNNNNLARTTNLYRTNNVNLVAGGEEGSSGTSAGNSHSSRPWNVPSVQVNDVPISEQPSLFQQRIMSHRQRLAERVSELRSFPQMSVLRPRFLHPLYASVNPFDADLDDPQRETNYDFDMITTVTPNHRIQMWDISSGHIPVINNPLKNIIVSECKIHNDASVDIAKDGTILVTLLPSGGYLNVTNKLGVYSLKWDTLGQCLYTTSFEQNAVSVALSPLSRHLVVGLASRRVSIVPSDRWTMARIFIIDQKNVPGDKLPVLRELGQSRDSRATNYKSVNCIRWLPTSGQGLIYATNTGQLVILS